MPPAPKRKQPIGEDCDSLPQVIYWCHVAIDNLRFYEPEGRWTEHPLVSKWLQWYDRQFITDVEYRELRAFVEAEWQRAYQRWRAKRQQTIRKHA